MVTAGMRELFDGSLGDLHSLLVSIYMAMEYERRDLGDGKHLGFLHEAAKKDEG